jgi:predicted XRE-type DNA-binding protein
MQLNERIRQVATDISRYTIDPVTQCWNWTGAKLRSGHGMVKVCGKSKMAYRVFFTFFIGTIAVGLQLHHTCENPSCVNPYHVIAVTPGEHSRLHAKLNFAKAAEIRRLYHKEGLRQKEIASRFGVDQTTISCVLTSKTWKDAEVPQTRMAA